MALIDCPECSHKISDQSISCPSCGFVTSKINIVKPSNSVQKSQVRKQKKKAKHYAIQDLIAVLGLIFLVYKLVTCSSDSSEETVQVQTEDTMPDSKLTPIPMLIAGAGEDGRYFLISHNTANSLENIEYLRKGKESDTYGKMQINCSNNKIRKNSTDSAAALDMLDLREWYTPDPNWTDKDIFNFICK